MKEKKPVTKKPKQAKGPAKEKHAGGRPRIEFNMEMVYQWGRFRATYETMADIAGCSIDTINRLMQDDESEFCKHYKRGLAETKVKLSEAQIWRGLGGTMRVEKALGSGDIVTYNAFYPPDSTMLIWLGKQYLGQKDKIAEEVPNQPLTVRLIPHKQADDTE